MSYSNAITTAPAWVGGSAVLNTDASATEPPMAKKVSGPLTRVSSSVKSKAGSPMNPWNQVPSPQLSVWACTD